MVAVSSGARVRRSTTSASMPSAASRSAARRATPTIFDQATTVTSRPGRLISAGPMGTRCSPSGTGPNWK